MAVEIVRIATEFAGSECVGWLKFKLALEERVGETQAPMSDVPQHATLAYGYLGAASWVALRVPLVP